MNRTSYEGVEGFMQNKSKLWVVPPLAYLVLAYLTAFYGFSIYRHFPFMSKRFGDLLYLTYTSDCFQSIPNWNLDTPTCDPFNRPGNYPPSLVWLFANLRIGTEDSNLVGLAFLLALGIISGLMSYLLRYQFLSKVKLLTWTLFWISPPVMLLAERGNVDTLIFLLVLPILMKKEPDFLSILSWLAASALKIFPVILLPAILINNRLSRSKRISILALALVAFSMNFGSMSKIFSRTYQVPEFSFGLRQPFYVVQYFFNTEWLPPKFQIFSQAFFAALILLIIFFLFRVKHQNLDGFSPSRNYQEKITNSIWLFTGIFSLGNSFDYRLIFFVPILYFILLKSNKDLVFSHFIHLLLLLMILNLFSFEKLPIPFLFDVSLYFLVAYLFADNCLQLFRRSKNSLERIRKPGMEAI